MCLFLCSWLSWDIGCARMAKGRWAVSCVWPSRWRHFKITAHVIKTKTKKKAKEAFSIHRSKVCLMNVCVNHGHQDTITWSPLWETENQFQKVYYLAFCSLFSSVPVCFNFSSILHLALLGHPGAASPFVGFVWTCENTAITAQFRAKSAGSSSFFDEEASWCLSKPSRERRSVWERDPNADSRPHAICEFWIPP